MFENYSHVQRLDNNIFSKLRINTKLNIQGMFSYKIFVNMTYERIS